MSPGFRKGKVTDVDSNSSDSSVVGGGMNEEQFTCVGCGFDYPVSSRNENDEGYCYDCRDEE